MCAVLRIDRTVSPDWQQIRTRRAVPENLSAFSAALIASDAPTARSPQDRASHHKAW